MDASFSIVGVFPTEQPPKRPRRMFEEATWRRPRQILDTDAINIRKYNVIQSLSVCDCRKYTTFWGLARAAAAAETATSPFTTDLPAPTTSTG